MNVKNFSEWLAPLIAGLSAKERGRLARRLATKLRQSNSRRVASQRNTDGSNYPPRKPQANRDKRGAIKRGVMFRKIRANRFLLLRTSPNMLALGFVGRVARIARIHQYGLRGLVQEGGPEYQYPVRELLGFSQEDVAMLQEETLAFLDQASSK